MSASPIVRRSDGVVFFGRLLDTLDTFLKTPTHTHCLVDYNLAFFYLLRRLNPVNNSERCYDRTGFYLIVCANLFLFVCVLIASFNMNLCSIYIYVYYDIYMNLLYHLQ